MSHSSNDNDVCVEEEPKKPTLSTIFTFRNVIASFQAAFKKRKGGIRHIVVILILLFGLFRLSCMGAGLVKFLNFKHEFNWTSTDYFNEWYSTYSAVEVN